VPVQLQLIYEIRQIQHEASNTPGFDLIKYLLTSILILIKSHCCRVDVGSALNVSSNL